PTPGDDDPATYVRRVAMLTLDAHAVDVAVEAELGHLPCGASGAVDNAEGALTDPDAAAQVVAQTDVDLRARRVGNVQIRIKGNRDLDLDRVAAIRRASGVPLVLHGGTGIAAEALRGAIARGVAKVNYGTYLKQRLLASLRAGLGSAESDPHRLLGMGGPEDL